MSNNEIKIHNVFLKVITLALVFFLTGCEKAPSYRAVTMSKTLRDRTAILMRKRKIAEMQQIEEARLKEFNKDMEILKKRNPFSPPVVVSEPDLATSLILEGIIWDEETPSAMINDMIISEGDVIGNKKVKKITKDSVILIEDGKEFILKLKKFY